jgi:hypothetical protein
MLVSSGHGHLACLLELGIIKVLEQKSSHTILDGLDVWEEPRGSDCTYSSQQIATCVYSNIYALITKTLVSSA